MNLIILGTLHKKSVRKSTPVLRRSAFPLCRWPSLAVSLQDSAGGNGGERIYLATLCGLFSLGLLVKVIRGTSATGGAGRAVRRNEGRAALLLYAARAGCLGLWGCLGKTRWGAMGMGWETRSSFFNDGLP